MRPAGAPRDRDALSVLVLQSTRKMHETRDERISRPNDGKREKDGDGERERERWRPNKDISYPAGGKSVKNLSRKGGARARDPHFLYLSSPSSVESAFGAPVHLGKRKEEREG